MQVSYRIFSSLQDFQLIFLKEYLQEFYEGKHTGIISCRNYILQGFKI